VLLVREAGGLVAPIREGQDLLEDGQVIAGAGEIFDTFAAVIRVRPEV
jgi:myo-inositol-1(or 4)-monophosphatase